MRTSTLFLVVLGFVPFLVLGSTIPGIRPETKAEVHRA